jgi:hypothetical protein
MSSPEEAAQGARPRRRWFQFGLRTLLILVAAAAVFLAFVGVRWYRGYLERQAVAEVQKVQGWIARNKEGQVDRVYLAGPQIDDPQLERLVPHLNHLWHLRELDLVNNTVTDKGLMHVARLYTLRELYLLDTQVTAAGVEKLQQARPELTIKQTLPNPIGSGMAMRDIYNHAVLAVAFSPNGRWLASGSADGTLHLWDVAAQSIIWTTAAHTDWLFSLAFSPDGARLATGGGDNAIRLWDVAGRRETAELAGHRGDVHDLAFTPDGGRLVSASDDRTVRVWDLDRMEERFSLKGHSHTIPGLAVSRDGSWAASASRDDTIRLWDVTTGRLIRVLQGHAGDVTSVAFSADGRTLASASYDKTIKLWNMADGTLRSTLHGHDDWVFAVTFSTDSSRVISGAGDGLRLWDAASGESLSSRGEQRNISSLAFSPCGEILASSSAEGNIALRDASSGGIKTVLWTRYGERGLKGLGIRLP